jgi:hypothetical protein
VPAPDRSPLLPDEARALNAQLDEVRAKLVHDAGAAGVDRRAVMRAVDEAARTYRNAPVRNFIGVLVERTVREQLGVPKT